MNTYETFESKIIDTLKSRDGKWTGLHIILMRFDSSDWAKAWHIVHRLEREEIIEKKACVQYHDFTKTPCGMFYLYRYIPRPPPRLKPVE